jgi:hypothetical protein
VYVQVSSPKQSALQIAAVIASSIATLLAFFAKLFMWSERLLPRAWLHRPHHRHRTQVPIRDRAANGGRQPKPRPPGGKSQQWHQPGVSLITTAAAASTASFE